MKRLWMLAAAAAIGLAQDAVWDAPEMRIYVAYREATKAGAAEVVTVQQAAKGTRTVHLDAASVYCSVDCVVSVERNGTAATGTALTRTPVNTATAATATAWHTSNAGTGTVLAKYLVTAGTDKKIGLRGVVLRQTAPGENVTIRTASITGDVRIVVRWGER